MTHPTKLSTKAACRVARMDRDRLNEAIKDGLYPCAPETIPGRARYFDPDDMIGLWLYRELNEDGCSKVRAGQVACAVMAAAKENPEADAISYVELYVGSRRAVPADQVPGASDWSSVSFSGSDIRTVTTFNIAKIRKLIVEGTAEELSFVGEED